MDFALVIVFLALYYVRPQEWITGLETLRPVMVVFIAAIVATLFRKPGFSPRDLLKTPHDWLMLAFLFWIALATASDGGNWMDISGILTRGWPILWGLKNKFGFYFIVMLALYNRERIEKFLWWWLGTILCLALLAVASEFGIDPMGSYELTHGPRFDGRLVLNNSMFNNPNELGHTIIPLIPLIYLLCVWKRSPLVKQVALAILFIPLYCVFLTRSKGSAISGAVTGVVAFAFGRPKVVQAAVLALALTAGVTAIMLLPRMSDLHNPRRDEGIQGRLSVFYFGYEACWLKNSLFGMGNFGKNYKAVYGEEKAPHSSFNAIGAELGVVGLFLYLSIYYSCLKTLVTAKTRNITEERIRRVLMGAIVSFMVSSWMVDFGYHSTFFFMVACVAAYHRLLLKPVEEEAKETEEDGTIYYPIAPLFSTASEGTIEKEEPVYEGTEKSGEQQNPPQSSYVPGLTWSRYGPVDFVATFVFLIVTIKLWAYFIFSWGT